MIKLSSTRYKQMFYNVSQDNKSKFLVVSEEIIHGLLLNWTNKYFDITTSSKRMRSRKGSAKLRVHTNSSYMIFFKTYFTHSSKIVSVVVFIATKVHQHYASMCLLFLHIFCFSVGFRKSNEGPGYRWFKTLPKAIYISIQYLYIVS